MSKSSFPNRVTRPSHGLGTALATAGLLPTAAGMAQASAAPSSARRSAPLAANDRAFMATYSERSREAFCEGAIRAKYKELSGATSSVALRCDGQSPAQMMDRKRSGRKTSRSAFAGLATEVRTSRRSLRASAPDEHSTLRTRASQHGRFARLDLRLFLPARPFLEFSPKAFWGGPHPALPIPARCGMAQDRR